MKITSWQDVPPIAITVNNAEEYDKVNALLSRAGYVPLSFSPRHRARYITNLRNKSDTISRRLMWGDTDPSSGGRRVVITAEQLLKTLGSVV